MTIPFFKSHYSIGKSILTLKGKGESIENGPQSIIDLCVDNEVDGLTLVDDSMSGFLEGYLNTKAVGLKFRFGLRISVCDDKGEKNEGALGKTSKIIIFANSEQGYKLLIKIYSCAAKDGFYYVPRTDYKTLASLWDNKHLSLVVPFYDSFLHRNTLYGSVCVPDFSFCEPIFAVEKNDIPFNYLIEKSIKQYAKNQATINVKSIYYKDREDFRAYLTFRCINKRSTLNRPNLEHMTSNEFCFQDWKEAA